ncbi:hypothetical protein [Paracidovorax konjaci]|uniref:Uncharacterized protein n=1 Tax=Paracidovorax konjaci TaxID=32040 RepID=A0A1I1Y1T6_9BURK|nr:hypothetical protein [Paracidovorax konjaci]SFE13665.1 hypothetical protein SAMN04489710_11585 [Paracidovorax konjaci]
MVSPLRTAPSSAAARPHPAADAKGKNAPASTPRHSASTSFSGPISPRQASGGARPASARKSLKDAGGTQQQQQQRGLENATSARTSPAFGDSPLYGQDDASIEQLLEGLRDDGVLQKHSIPNADTGPALAREDFLKEAPRPAGKAPAGADNGSIRWAPDANLASLTWQQISQRQRWDMRVAFLQQNDAKGMELWTASRDGNATAQIALEDHLLLKQYATKPFRFPPKPHHHARAAENRPPEPTPASLASFEADFQEYKKGTAGHRGPSYMDQVMSGKIQPPALPRGGSDGSGPSSPAPADTPADTPRHRGD